MESIRINEKSIELLNKNHVNLSEDSLETILWLIIKEFETVSKKISVLEKQKDSLEKRLTMLQNQEGYEGQLDETQKVLEQMIDEISCKSMYRGNLTGIMFELKKILKGVSTSTQKN